MFKKYFLNGLAAGIFSGLAAFFYYRIYITALEVSYSSIVSPASICSASLFAGMLIALLCFGIDHLFKKEVLTNLVLVCGAFVSIVIPFMISLPLDIERPELFPGLVVPMQLFPVLGWIAFKPMFRN